MKLTPLKIPGKRRREGEPTAVAPRKRIMTRPRSRAQKSAEGTASYLEHMPLEILEHIFWFSENVNLTRASPRIGRLLSGLSTRQETFISAFKPTWDACFGLIFPRSHSGHDLSMSDQLKIQKGNPEFQSALLEFSWADISFILKCWDLYIGRRSKQEPLSGPLHTLSRFKFCFPQPPRVMGRIMRKRGAADKMTSSEEFWIDYRLFRDWEVWERDTRRGRVSQYMVVFAANTFHQVNKDTRIPDKLLLSTASETDLQKLFWIVRGGASLAPDQDWEFTQEIFHNALTEHGQFSYAVMAILVLLGATKSWPEHVRSKARRALLDLPKDVRWDPLLRYQFHCREY
ncbi:hypothetical protein F4805DRAFT_13168 [Annulohypoxylon moriforme]|nr:hypothetical protein F4805DRAFT_13168 [Annulohypoxylon moriforme]